MISEVKGLKILGKVSTYLSVAFFAVDAYNFYSTPSGQYETEYLVDNIFTGSNTLTAKSREALAYKYSKAVELVEILKQAGYVEVMYDNNGNIIGWSRNEEIVNKAASNLIYDLNLLEQSVINSKKGKRLSYIKT